MYKILKAFQKPKKKTVFLCFGEPGTTNQSEWETKEYLMRGGVCFPVMHETAITGMEVSGHVVLCGREESTGSITVFEDKKFVVVSDIINEKTNMVDHEGVASFFNMCWGKYLCRAFFWQQSEYIAEKNKRKIRRTGIIQPKPLLIETEVDLNEVLQEVAMLTATKKIIMDRNSEVPKALAKQGKKGKDFHPAVHALACAVSGLDIYNRDV